MTAAPSAEALDAFGVAGFDPVPLSGGEGKALLVGDLVLKPCDDPVEWSWLGDVLPGLRQDGFRLAPPVRAVDGRWVVDGWSAQSALEGDHAERWSDVLAVGELFHVATADLERPAFLDTRTHPWAVGDRVAWEEAEAPVAHPLLERVLALREPLALSGQVIHGDLTENVLFADGLPPAIIDLTPYFRPASFASAVVIGDAVRWHDADPEPLLETGRDDPDFSQLFVRAVIYRLVTTLMFDRREVGYFESDVALAERLTG